MRDAIAVLNAGSSSVKLALFALDDAGPRSVLRAQVEGLHGHAAFAAKDERGALIGAHDWDGGEGPDHAAAARYLLDFLRNEAAEYALAGAGHRVVHGGTAFASPVRVTAELLAALARLVPLAPLHQPHNLAVIRVIAAEAPELAQVACFDTAFHRTQDPLAQAFALPPSVTERGVRRYGFHGLSYEYIASKMPEIDAVAARGKVVVAHLGNGASMCAIDRGRSVASTMGLTALDGLMMGTRPGALDPGVLLFLMKDLGLDAQAIERLLYHESGLLGVSGVSSDVRKLLASDDPRAKFAIDLFCYRAARELGSLAAALGGLDALVFTGGIGEHAAPVRAAIVERAGWLGLELDASANARHGPRITTPDSDVPAYVVPTHEELMIARHVVALLKA